MKFDELTKIVEMYEKAESQKENKNETRADHITLRFYVYLSYFLNRIFRKDISDEKLDALNEETMRLVIEKIKKHPIIWRLFFMI